MRKITLLLFYSLFIVFAYGQAGQWTWIHGDSTANKPGNYGTQGVSSPTNTPPNLYEAVEWTDKQGNFWLFGGSGSPNGTHSDLWKYNPANNEWTWISGPGYAVTSDAGVYGTKGVPSAGNKPPARGWGAASWTDNNGDFWVFGGRVGSSGNLGNDLWKYNVATNIWTWMSGSSTTGQAGVYGTKGVAAPANVPGSRQETDAAWVDNNNNLWLYGGGGNNDLWKFDTGTNQWTWEHGSSVGGVGPTYGIQGVPDTANTPGWRWVYCKWKDANDDLWLFGGRNGSSNFLNDLWRYNIATNSWTWMDGPANGDSLGMYVSQCSPSFWRRPSGHFENRASWVDSCNTFWFWGGGGLVAWVPKNDLWNYNPATNEWRWVSGDSTVNPVPLYGTINVSLPATKPPALYGSVGWTDYKGNLYIFGGTADYTSFYNEMFKYTMSPTCGLCLVTPVANFVSSDTIFCSETGKCINFFDRSTGNPTSWQWTFTGATPSTSTLQNPDSICYYAPGTYPVKLVISSPAGMDSLTVYPMITLLSGALKPTLSQSHDTIFCSHEAAYQWYYNGGPIPGAIDSFYVSTSAGTYSVYITDKDGCSRFSDGWVITSADQLTGSGLQFTIVPNPTHDHLRIQGLQFTNGPIIIELYNVFGEKVCNSQLETINSKLETVVDISSFTNGVYVVQLSNEGKIFRAKVLKQ